MTEEQKAEELWKKADKYVVTTGNNDCTIDAYIAGYHECQKEHEKKCKTAYIKGVRTMANALKDYDRTDGAWTDYFEHTVDKVLKDLLSKEGTDNDNVEIKELEDKNETQAKILETNLEELANAGKKIKELEQQIEKMKRHCNCKHRDNEGYCEVKRTYLMDLSYNGCDKWELED